MNTSAISPPTDVRCGMTKTIAATPMAAPRRQPQMRSMSLCVVSPMVPSEAT